MLKIGICGGTFDPFHNGHMALISAALDSGRIDRLLVIPAGDPPHKQHEPVMPAIYRYEMTRKSLRDIPSTRVVDLEILKEGRSYTLDTIRMVRAEYQEPTEIYLIYGSDIIYDLEKWHEPEALLAECTMLLAIRGGDDEKRVSKLAARLNKKFNAKIELFKAPKIELSSTEIRERIIAGKNWKKSVPGPAAAVISDNKFYTLISSLEMLNVEDRGKTGKLERSIWPWLTHKRLLHSANVMLYAIKLANEHGVDLYQAAAAGLLHDCAKCLQHDQLMDYAARAGDEQLLQEELAHGPAGAVMAKEIFCITDQEILQSVHYHTTGRAGMTKLEKIIFLADKIELGRTYHDLDPIREAAETDLDQAMLICLTEVESFLRRSNRPSHPYSLDAISEIRQKNKKE
ncbi:MAG: nicotinate (nicotinamide) nucleotide adenylyltransferase [Clostridiaceae bacterium]|nr:nicotinate (nicotinamide) nucleotide adenylyltransferase [Clostridiaceae bacterium]